MTSLDTDLWECGLNVEKGVGLVHRVWMMKINLPKNMKQCSEIFEADLKIQFSYGTRETVRVMFDPKKKSIIGKYEGKQFNCTYCVVSNNTIDGKYVTDTGDEKGTFWMINPDNMYACNHKHRMTCLIV